MAQPGTTQRAFERKVGPVSEPMLWAEDRFVRLSRETAAARVLLYKRITEEREDEFRYAAGALHTIIDFAPGITAASQDEFRAFRSWRDVFDHPTRRAAAWDFPSLVVGQLWNLGRLGPGQLPKGTGKNSVLTDGDRLAVFALASLMVTGQFKKMHHAGDLLFTLYHPGDALRAEIGKLEWSDFYKFIADSERVMRTSAATIVSYADEVRQRHRPDSDNRAQVFENLREFAGQNLYRRADQTLEDYLQQVPFGSHLISLCHLWEKHKDMKAADLAPYAIDGYRRGLINYTPVTMEGVDVNKARKLTRERNFGQFSFIEQDEGVVGTVRDTYFVAPGVTGSIRAEVDLEMHELRHDTLLSGLKLDSRIVRQMALVRETMAALERDNQDEGEGPALDQNGGLLDYALQSLEARRIEISPETRRLMARGAADVVSLQAPASGDRDDSREMIEVMTADDRREDWGIPRGDDPEMFVGLANLGWQDFEERVGASITKTVRTALAKGDREVALVIEKLATTTIRQALPGDDSIAQICGRLRTAGHYPDGEEVARMVEASARYIRAEPVTLNSPDHRLTVGARLVARVSENMHKAARPPLFHGENGALNLGE